MRRAGAGPVTRRLVLAAVLIAMSIAAPVRADDYPNRPIRLVVPFPPGGNNDVMGRLIAAALAPALGQPIVVDNRVGATGLVGSELVARAPADGYTLLLGGQAVLVLATQIFKDVPFDPLRDLTPIAGVASQPLVLVVNPEVPARNVVEFVALAKREPGKLNYASNSNGSSTHLAAEMFKAATGTDLTHVPYKGDAPAVADLLAGQVDAFFANFATILPLVQAGKLRALATASAQHLSLLPDLPTLSETVAPGFDAYTWFCIMGPAGLPPAIVERLNREVVRALATAGLRQHLAELGVDPMPLSPPALGDLMRAEYAKWGEVIKSIGVTPG
jgi:tripartite-type tricarboxylate transporter receptor subunit TctC